MYVRCGSCGICTRVPLARSSPDVNCIACGRVHSLARVDELGATPDARYHRAQEYAASQGIDLASAYSVLLGLLPLEEAPSIHDGPAEMEAPSPAAPKPAELPQSHGLYTESDGVRRQRRRASELDSYDPGFRDAVAAGYLTLRQAVERGDRILYASKLASRNDLPMSLAFLVAENRMPLRQAIEQAGGAKRDDIPPGREASRFASRTIAALGLSLVTLCCAGVWFWGHPEEGSDVERVPSGAGPNSRRPPPPQAARTEGEIRTNADGQMIAVGGPTPRSVLNAFCEATRKPGHREPVSVVPSGDAWLGYFKQAGALHAIAIRKAPGSRGWVAGDGLGPLPVTEASRVRQEPARAGVPAGGEVPATTTSR